MTCVHRSVQHTHRIVQAHRSGVDLTTPGKRVLDFGCGDGQGVQALLEAGADAYGVDVSPEAIAEAELIVPGRCLVGENHFPWPDAHFDFVVSNQVIEHVVDLDEAMAEVARVMKPGGVFLSVHPAKWQPVEMHIFVPFAHWLPPGQLRQRWLAFCFARGWGESNGATAEQQDAYLRDHTFYRSRAEIRRCLSPWFDVRFVAAKQLTGALNDRNRSLPGWTHPVVEWGAGTFHEHRVLAVRRA